MDVDPVMIGPHQAKLQPVRVGCFHKTLLYTAFQKETILIIVPVEDKSVDPVIGGGIYFLRHLLGIGLIRIAPGRDIRLDMPLETRFGRFHQLPFRPAFALYLLIPGIAVMIIGKIIRRNKTI